MRQTASSLRYMLRISAGIVLLFGFVALTGCAARVDIAAQTAKELRYGDYKTFHLLRHEVGRAEGADTAIEQSIIRSMAAQGYTAAPVERADLMVSYKLLIGGEDREATGVAPVVRTRPIPAVGGAWDGALHADYVDDAGTPSQRKVLLVLLQEARSYRVVWIGWAMSDVEPKQTPVRALETIPRIMEKVPRRR